MSCKFDSRILNLFRVESEEQCEDIAYSALMPHGKVCSSNHFL